MYVSHLLSKSKRSCLLILLLIFSPHIIVRFLVMESEALRWCETVVLLIVQ